MKYTAQVVPYYQPIEGEQIEADGHETLLTFKRIVPITASPIPDGFGMLSEIAWAA